MVELVNWQVFITPIIQPVKIDSEAWIHLPSLNWYQFAESERIAGYVSPEHVGLTGSQTQYLQLASPVSQPLHYRAR